MTSDGEHLSLQALHAIQWVHRVGAIILTGTVIYLFSLLRLIPGIGFLWQPFNFSHYITIYYWNIEFALAFTYRTSYNA